MGTNGGSARLVSAGLAFTCLVSAAVAAVIVGLDRVDLPLLPPGTGTTGALLFVVLAAATALTIVLDSILIAQGDALGVLGRGVLFSVGKLVLPFLMRGEGAVGLLLAWLLPLFAAIVFGWRRAHQRARAPVIVLRDFGVKERRTILFNYVATLLIAIPPYALPVLVSNLAGPSIGAHYYVASMFAMLIVALPQNSLPWLLGHAHSPEAYRSAERRLVQVALLLGVPMLIAAAWIGPMLLGLLGAQYRTEGAPALYTLLVAAVPTIAFSFALTRRRAQDHRWSVLLSCAVVGLGSIFGGYIAIRDFGAPAAGLVWAAASTAGIVVVSAVHQ